MAEARFCVACGRPLPDEARFCGGCGRSVEAASGPPSAGPPPEDPHATGPPPPTGPPPADGPRAISSEGGDAPSRRGVVVLAALLLVGGIAIALAVGGGGEDHREGGREVFLEARASAGPDPFTPSLQPAPVGSSTSASSTSSSSSTSISSSTSTTDAPAAGGGGAPRTARGPFGGTGDDRLCDRELLVRFLTDAGNETLAREWARVLDIRVRDIPTYVRSLVPTTLTADARVTNHRWSGGRAVGYQAVLERGTAVLVDVNGRLVARCRCGNPLTPPVEVADPVYTGPRWDGFDPTVVVVVVAAPTPIYAPGGSTTVPPTTTTILAGADEAVRRIRGPFEACARASVAESGGFLTSADVENLLPGVQYTATLLDASTQTYRVDMTVPGRTIENGEFVSGSTASWEVRLSDGEVTPSGASAAQLGDCPGLA